MTRDQAIDIARVKARTCYERHGYLPVTVAEAETWQPHEWVIESILWAAGFKTSLPVDAALRVEQANQHRTNEARKDALMLEDTETLAAFVLALRGER